MQQQDIAHKELQEMQSITSVSSRSGYSIGRLPKFLLSIICHKLSLCRYLKCFPLALAKDTKHNLAFSCCGNFSVTNLTILCEIFRHYIKMFFDWTLFGQILGAKTMSG